MPALPRTAPAALAAIVLANVAGTAPAAPAGASHAALCVAALKSRESSMAHDAHPAEGAEPELSKVVQSGIAIIGTQYLAGLREAEARRLLGAAESEFQALPAAAAEARQAACLDEGYGLYRRASPIERSLITVAAERRIRRLRAG